MKTLFGICGGPAPINPRVQAPVLSDGDLSRICDATTVMREQNMLPTSPPPPPRDCASLRAEAKRKAQSERLHPRPFSRADHFYRH